MDPVPPSSKLAVDSISIPPSNSLHLSVTRTWGNRTLAIKSPAWRKLRAEILDRDNRTCASCGYASPHPNGRGLKIDHKDGDASNNDYSNLRVHCPPCESIRHCGLAGLNRWVILAKSDVDQIDIVRGTRTLFEESGSIPTIHKVDPFATRVEMKTVYLANKLMKMDWNDLTEEERGLKAFFTPYAEDLFAVTMDTEYRRTQASNLSVSDKEALKIREMERTRPWITFSSETHSTFRNFFAKYPPSTISQSDVAWICIRNSRLPTDDNESTNIRDLEQAWQNACSSRQPTTDDLDELARRFKELSGKWMVFAKSSEIDALWSRIASATHSGTLGYFAKVSPRSDSPSHVICVYTRDYTDRRDVDKVRDGLRRLGVKWSIGYKPDVYTHCAVYKGNSWNIAPARYHS